MLGAEGECPHLFPAGGRWWCAAIYRGTAENRLRRGTLRRSDIIHGLHVSFGCGCTNPYREDGPLAEGRDAVVMAMGREIPAPNVFEFRAAGAPDWPLPRKPRANWKPRQFI
jgi:hypothetical protein